MRENRTYGSEGGDGSPVPYPYRERAPLYAFRVIQAWAGSLRKIHWRVGPAMTLR